MGRAFEIARHCQKITHTSSIILKYFCPYFILQYGSRRSKFPGLPTILYFYFILISSPVQKLNHYFNLISSPVQKLNHYFNLISSPVQKLNHYFNLISSPVLKLNHYFNLISNPVQKLNHYFKSLTIINGLPVLSMIEVWLYL